MSAPTPSTEPAVIRAGDTASWLLSLADYPATDGWSVMYVLINSAGKITLNSTASGADHHIYKAAADTEAFPAGTYAWQCRVVKGDDAYTIRTGSIDVLPFFTGLDAIDSRSHAQKTLAALEAWIESRDLGVAEYQIAGRQMRYIPIKELLELRAAYQREVRKNSGKSGRVFVRF